MQFARHNAPLRRSAKAALAATVALLVTAWPAYADLTLTPAGVADNFTLSTFATGFPTSFNVGPLGMGFVNGHVLISDYPGNVRVFATDTDGQTAGAAPIAQNYGHANAVGIAQLGGNIYMTQQYTGDLVQINSDGTFNQIIATGLSGATGIVADMHNGTLFVSDAGNNPTSLDAIYKVDPIAKTKTPFLNVDVDGLCLSPDGSVLYTANNNGHIYGYNTSTTATVFDSGFIPGFVDGTAIGTGVLAGNLFANTNDGTVYAVNLTTLAQTEIASGGSRGDFVSMDPNNGTLLLTQSDRILRLSIPNGGFGTVPEPSSVAPFLLGALGLGGLLLRARRRSSARTL